MPDANDLKGRLDDLYQRLHRMEDYCADIADAVMELRPAHTEWYMKRSVTDAVFEILDVRSEIQLIAADLDCLRGDLVEREGGRGPGVRFQVTLAEQYLKAEKTRRKTGKKAEKKR